jgi:hypothetical protein
LNLKELAAKSKQSHDSTQLEEYRQTSTYAQGYGGKYGVQKVMDKVGLLFSDRLPVPSGVRRFNNVPLWLYTVLTLAFCVASRMLPYIQFQSAVGFDHAYKSQSAYKPVYERPAAVTKETSTNIKSKFESLSQNESGLSPETERKRLETQTKIRESRQVGEQQRQERDREHHAHKAEEDRKREEEITARRQVPGAKGGGSGVTRHEPAPQEQVPYHQDPVDSSEAEPVQVLQDSAELQEENFPIEEQRDISAEAQEEVHEKLPVSGAAQTARVLYDYEKGSKCLCSNSFGCNRLKTFGHL